MLQLFSSSFWHAAVESNRLHVCSSPVLPARVELPERVRKGACVLKASGSIGAPEREGEQGLQKGMLLHQLKLLLTHINCGIPEMKADLSKQTEHCRIRSLSAVEVLDGFLAKELDKRIIQAPRGQRGTGGCDLVALSIEGCRLGWPLDPALVDRIHHWSEQGTGFIEHRPPRRQRY